MTGWDWLTAEEPARVQRRAKVTVHVQAAFEPGRGCYGVRRVQRVLARSTDLEVASVSEKLSGR